MHRLRKIVVAGLVWATSASMLMAATPFVVCRCPNGDIKPFCFASAKSSCCSDGKCCSTDGGSTSCCKSKSGGHSCCAPQGASDKVKGIGAKKTHEGPS